MDLNINIMIVMKLNCFTKQRNIIILYILIIMKKLEKWKENLLVITILNNGSLYIIIRLFILFNY